MKKVSFKNETLISIVGESYFQPIADLVFKLKEIPIGENDVKVNSIHNGYACSACLLSVVVIESFVMRAKYMLQKKPPLSRTTCFEYLPATFRDFKRKNQLMEVFVLRDVIAHNHLWSIDFSWDEDLGLRMLKAKKDKNSGDKKYAGCVNPKTFKSDKLKLNVNPIKVSKLDLKKVINEMWKTLMFLENKNRRLCYVSQIFIRDGKKPLEAKKLFGQIEKYL